MAGVAGALPPAAFYTRPPVPPPSLGRRNLGTPELPSPSTVSSVPAGLTKALTKLSESISLIRTQLLTQATAQEAINRSLEHKISVLSSQVNRDRDRSRNHGRTSDASGPRPPPVVCTFCKRPGHSIENGYTKERADRAEGSRLATPSAYMTDSKATDEPTPLAHHQAFLATVVAPHPPVPTKDRAQAQALALSLAASPATPLTSQPGQMSIVFDTGATAHMWGSRTGMSSYTAYPHPRWIGGLSKYAHGCGTVVLKLDPSAHYPD